MTKPEKIKVILLSFMVFIIMYSLALFNFQNNSDVDSETKKNTPRNFLEHNFNVFYGNQTSNDDAEYLSIKLDEIGEVAVLFESNVFAAEDYSVLDFSIENLPINYRPFLVWQTKNDATIHQMELFQPDGGFNTNLLNRNVFWKGDIVQFGIRIAPQTHLGLSIPYDKDIIFKQVSLRKVGFIKDYFLLFDYWTQYDPLSYIVLNRIEANKNLPYYAQPFILIAVWTLFSFIIVLLILKRNVFFILVIVSWLFLGFFQVNNMAKISKWSSNVYANDMKINVDQQLYDIAMRVKSFLKLDLVNSEKLKQTKVLVLSSDKYQRARIIYHMLPVNSSFLDINLEIITQSRISIGDYIMSMSLTGFPRRPVDGELVFKKKTIKVKEVWHDDIVSIMEVL